MIKGMFDMFKTAAVKDAERAQEEIRRIQTRIVAKLDQEEGDVRELARKMLKEIAKHA